MKKIVPVLVLAVCGPLLACAGTPSEAGAPVPETVASDAKGQGHRVIEVIQAGKYTYVQVERDGETIWVAAPGAPVEPGDEVELPESLMPMKNWHSKTLDRTWDLVYFVGAISKAGAEMPVPGHGRPAAKSPMVEFDYSGVTVPEGGKTVAALFEETESLQGKPVTVRGIVVKVSANIMGKNWVHIRDGSGGPGTNDLTVTTSSLPEVADTVVVAGVLGTGIDFGAGYVFDVIVEDAELTIE